MTFDTIVQVFLRLKSLLDQYDNVEKNIAEMEMQREILYRIPEDNDEVRQAKSITHGGIKTLISQRDAAIRAIEDFTGTTPDQLRERISEIGVRIEQVSSHAIEEKKLRAGFEILVETNSFDQEENGETRAEFEERLSQARKIREAMLVNLSILVNKSLNKKSIIVPTDSVLKKLWADNTDSTKQPSKLITV